MHCHAPALRHVAMSAVGEGWTCKVEGQKELTHASGDYLHATAPPPEGLALMLFERRLCTPEPLPLAELDNWLHAYQRDPAAPVDLRRKKPDSHLWWEVTTLQRSVESLTDDEPIPVHSLRTFQQPTIEPLGDDGGCAELATIDVARQRGSEAVRRTQSNAEPEMAEVRVACAGKLPPSPLP
ncbi:hypothetical protein ABPG75_004512 [Micractinium tetrahymenae]